MIDQYERHLAIMCLCLSAKQAPPNTEGLLGAEFLVLSDSLKELNSAIPLCTSFGDNKDLIR